MSDALEKRRKARQSKVSAGGHLFTITRPQPGHLARLGAVSNIDMVVEFVVDWDDSMTELALDIPGGTGAPVPFDRELFADWLNDHKEVWVPLATAIKDAYAAYEAAMEGAEKN